MNHNTALNTPQQPFVRVAPASAAPAAPQLASLIWRARPPSHGTMVPLELRGTQPAGRTMPLGKYDRKGYALSNAQLEAHLAGRCTVQAPLVAADGTARALCLDVDHGGRQALRQLLEAAAVFGLWAVAVYSPGLEHDGGHVWAFFAGDTQPERLAALGERMVQLARLEGVEVFPCGKKAIRLPFGVHLDTGRRGLAKTTDGEIFDLDDAGEVERILRAVEEHGRNSLGLVPPLPPKAPRSASSVVLGDDESPIVAYNRVATVDQVVSLLERLPGYSEHKRKGGRTILRCGCGQHSREKNPPAVYVELGRNGKALVNSFSTDCRWFAGPGQYHDAFAVYCEVNGLSPRDAAVQLLKEKNPHGPAHHSRGSRRDDGHAPAGAARAEPARAVDPRGLIPHAPHREPTAPPPAPQIFADGRTGRERLLHALRLHESRGGDCLASEAQLARCAGLSERYTRLLLRQLARTGAIQETRRYGQTTVRIVCEGGGSILTFRSPTCIHESESRVCSDHAWEKEGLPPTPAALPAPSPAELEAAVDADLARVLARRAEAAQRAGLQQLVFDLAAVAGADLPADLPADLGELEALAGELLALGERLNERADLEAFEVASGDATLQPEPAVITVGEVVQFDGGACFDPAAAGKVAPPKRPQSLEDHYACLQLLYEHAANRGGEAPAAAPPALETPAPAPELRRGPPKTPERRREWYRWRHLAETGRSPRQRAWAAAQARALEDVYTPEEWAARWQRSPAKPSATTIAGGVDQEPDQLELWGTATGREDPSFSQASARAGFPPGERLQVAICAD